MRQYDPSTQPPASSNPLPPDFPLFRRVDGRFGKKVRGKQWISKSKDWETALAEWLSVKDALLSGRKPRETQADGITVKELCNRFMDSKATQIDGGTIKPRTVRDYQRVCLKVITAFGANRRADDIGPDDFKSFRASINSSYGIYRQKNLIAYTKAVFYYGMASGLIVKPISFGPDFSPPSKASERRLKAARKPRAFCPHELVSVLAVSDPRWKAKILLGLNAALGPCDLCHLRTSHLDLDRGLLNYPRPKTGIARQSVLWPETVEAAKEALRLRPAASGPADETLVFRTKTGRSWGKLGDGDMISREFRRLLIRAGLADHRNLNFYGLRHTCRTVGSRCKDNDAVRMVMGHGAKGMDETYTEWFDVARLRAVAVEVRRWFLGVKPWGTNRGLSSFPVDVVSEVRADASEFLQTAAVLPW